MKALFALTVFCSPVQADDDDWFYSDEHVPSLQLIFPMDDWHDRLKKNFDTDKYVIADLLVDGVLIPDVGVQHKGDVSYTGKLRESMKITLDAFVPGQDLYGLDVITLDASRQSSVFHEVAALWVIAEFTDAPRANLAHLVAGTVDQSFDLGVFTNTERVDSAFARRHFGVAGHRYSLRDKSDNTYPPFTYLGDDVDNYIGTYHAQGGDPRTLWHDLAAASIDLEHAPDSLVRERADPVIDLDASIRSLIGNRMAGNFDSMEIGNNYYLLEDAFHASRMVPVVWDLDISWQLATDPIPDSGNYPLAKAFSPRPMQERAQSYVVFFYERSFAGPDTKNRLWDLFDRVIDRILNSPYEEYEDQGEVEQEVREILGTWRDMKDLVETDPRFTRALPELTEIAHSPRFPRASDAVWVQVRVSLNASALDQVLLWSRVRGHFQSERMFDDGAHGDGAAGDGVFGAMLPAASAGDVVEYYVEARPLDLAAAGYGYAPEETEFEPFRVRIAADGTGPLRLVEAVSDNETGATDEAGDFDDWIQISNLGAQSVDLGGHFLSDSADPRKWRFPDASLLGPGESLVVWCDEEPQEGRYHASFKLSKDGERVSLRAPDALGNELIDEILLPSLAPDQSFARVPDSGELWFHAEEPAPRRPFLEEGIARHYDGRRDGSAHGVRFQMDGSPKEGQTVRFEVSDGLPDGLAVLWFTAAPAAVDLGELGVLAVDLSIRVTLRVRLDGTGNGSFSVQIPSGLAGTDVFAQALSAGQDLTRALAFRIGS